jgi:Tfp pilus assembly protein PilP
VLVLADIKGSEHKSKKLSFLNNRLKIAAAVAGVLVLVLVAGFAMGMFGGKAPADNNSMAIAEASGSNENTTVLPQTVRTYQDPFESSGADPFSGPMKLVGLVLSGDGNHLCIIEAGGTAYVLKRGERIADYWKVISIAEKSVDLQYEDNDMTLQLADR